MVHASIFDEMIAALKAEAAKQRPGHGLGPLVSQAQFDRVQGYVKTGIREGAKVVVGGEAIGGALSAGHFFQPTILSDVPDELTVCREEVFGPVLVVQSFKTFSEAVPRANANNHGLAAGLWTKDLANAHRFAAPMEAGSVWVNCYNAFDLSAPFGGYKNSGYGRDGGEVALEKFLQVKIVWVNLA
jgi:aldehyde dehydrogenase (NAD+)